MGGSEKVSNLTKQDDKKSITMVIIFNFNFFNIKKTKQDLLLPVSHNGSPNYDSFTRFPLKGIQIEDEPPYDRKFL